MPRSRSATSDVESWLVRGCRAARPGRRQFRGKCRCPCPGRATLASASTISPAESFGQVPAPAPACAGAGRPDAAIGRILSRLPDAHEVARPSGRPPGAPRAVAGPARPDRPAPGAHPTIGGNRPGVGVAGRPVRRRRRPARRRASGSRHRARPASGVSAPSATTRPTGFVVPIDLGPQRAVPIAAGPTGQSRKRYRVSGGRAGLTCPCSHRRPARSSSRRLTVSATAATSDRTTSTPYPAERPRRAGP